jgi:hypothetical protein
VGVMMAINTVPYVVSFFDWDVDVDSHKPHWKVGVGWLSGCGWSPCRARKNAGPLDLDADAAAPETTDADDDDSLVFAWSSDGVATLTLLTIVVVSSSVGLLLSWLMIGFFTMCHASFASVCFFRSIGKILSWSVSTTTNHCLILYSFDTHTKYLPLSNSNGNVLLFNFCTLSFVSTVRILLISQY